VTVVLVHGLPETSEIWSPLRERLDRNAVAVALPGFGTARPDGFTATKDAYADWLAETLNRVDRPVDVVGHDVGALLAMRVASALDVPPAIRMARASARLAGAGGRRGDAQDSP
jgi:pimeloyl-ACP methyl ester carboxylesterase